MVGGVFHTFFIDMFMVHDVIQKIGLRSLSHVESHAQTYFLNMTNISAVL